VSTETDTKRAMHCLQAFRCVMGRSRVHLPGAFHPMTLSVTEERRLPEPALIGRKAALLRPQTLCQAPKRGKGSVGAAFDWNGEFLSTGSLGLLTEIPY